MEKKTIPLLIGAMALALIGIIVIQYKWIEQSLEEKQSLIDHKIHQAVANVDAYVSNIRGLAIISSIEIQDDEFQFPQSELLFHKTDSFPRLDTLLFRSKDPFDSTFPFNSEGDIEVQITTNDSQTFFAERKFDPEKSDMANSDSLNIFIAELKEELSEFNEVSSVFRKIKMELAHNESDPRLDSARFAKALMNEANSLGLVQPKYWGVFDDSTKSYIIPVEKEMKWDFEIPLFKNDILDPGRYIFRMNMADYNTIIRNEIYVMILLSLLFLAIIGFVFVYAIRLVIKHKKISEIKSDFINNMTHEFKTPLASISLAADSIIHPKISGDQEQIKHYVKVIKAEKTKLNQHIETILEVASLKENALEIEMNPILIENSLYGAKEKLSMLIEDQHCAIDIQLQGQSQIMGNAYYLENVFTNLIENSIKYSEGTPTVKITSRHVGDEVEILITDEGIGMTKEQISHAFDHFYRAQKGNIHNTKGFGLGLSFVKYMVTKMNGDVMIKSELKKGTTVTLKFPLWH